MPHCNSTLEDATIAEDPLWKSVTFHRFGLFFAAIFGLISIIISLFLVFQHATHYLKPWEQRHIIRILLMIPIYSTVSFLSYLYYQHAVYFEVLRDCYEAFAIASFFTLLCHYIAPTLHDQKEYFRGLTPINWFWGVFFLQKCTGGENKGPFRRPRSGLTWFNIVWIGVFQYCCIRVFFTIVSVVSEVFHVYCEASLSPAFAHIWTLGFEAVSVTIAMFCLIQFYLQLRVDLAEHKPFLKVLTIKLVIFFSFWQTIVISLLSSSNGPLQPSKKIAYQDIKVGIPSVLLCIEMAIFAVMHLFAFPWKEYSLKHNKDPLTAPGSGWSGETPKYKGVLYAFADAFNPWDIVKASARGFRWLFVGVKHRHEDPSYTQAQKLADSTAYAGPALFDRSATELRPHGAGNEENARRGRSDTFATNGSPEDDRAGLLGHTAGIAGHRVPSTSPCRAPTAYTNDEYSTGDDSAVPLPHYHAPPQQMPEAHAYGATPSEWDEEDTGYHPGIGPADVHPALRRDDDSGGRQAGWDHWGGGGRI